LDEKQFGNGREPNESVFPWTKNLKICVRVVPHNHSHAFWVEENGDAFAVDGVSECGKLSIEASGRK
jgi:hypothetical protein